MKTFLKPSTLLVFMLAIAFSLALFFFSKTSLEKKDEMIFSDNKTPTSELQEKGIFIEKASIKEGVIGNYQKEENIVYFRIKRGERNPWIERYLAEGPEYSMEIAFADNRGIFFLSQGQPRFPEGFNLLEDKKKIDQSSDISFSMAYDAVDILEEVDFGPELIHERKALTDSNFRE